MAGIPQVITEDRASGAQVIDGSLRFDDTKKNYLTQTIDSGTNGFTISCWMKPCQTGNRDEIFDTTTAPGFYLYRHTNGEIKINNNTVNLFTSNGKYVDTNAFYNIVFSYDSTSGYGSLYVNGRLDKTTAFTTQLYAGTAKISSEASNDPANYYLGQWYLIDGLALGPGYFGYTDPLTGTWRPKKFKNSGTTVNDGTRWRNYLTSSNGGWHADPYGLTAAFNGVVGSGSGGYAQAANGSANPNSVTFDVSSIGGIPFKNSVEVWLINNANTVTVNGGEAQSIAGTTFVTVARGPGVLNTIKFERPSTNGASLGTIRVDGVNLRDDLTQHVQFGAAGFYLPMDGNSPIGKNQAPSINDGTVWSSNLTSTQNFNLAVTRAFDGDTTTLAATANASNANILWTQTVTNVKTLRIYMDHDYQNYRVRVNGGSWHVDDTLGATQNSDWRDLTSLIPGNGTITSIESDTGGLNNGVNWSAVEINGDILIDSTTEKGNDWTPKNFGGSNSIEKATGAKPILNTANGGTTARPGVFGSDVSATYTTTSASNSGGQYYFSHDSSAKPTFSFIRGATYTFDYSASSSHPLRFATAADAAGSTEYTNGTNISGNVIKFTVPHNAPDTLYYYCNVHNGMGNSISVTTDETKADPYAWKNVLALPLVGVNDDESKNINCTQSAAKTITSYNTVASSVKSNFYGGSFYFDGNEDYLQCGNSSDYDMDGDFTAEAWVYPTSHANDYAGIFGFSYDSEGQGWNLLVRSSSGRLHINVDMNYTDVTNSLVLNKWTHLALVRSGTGSGNCKLYIDGVADPTTITDSDTTGTPSGAQCLIGSYPGYTNSREFTGYIQDARIYNGVAKYTENFIPASTNPNILPDTPSGVATKSKLKKITDGAVSFDGADGTALSVSNHADLQFGTETNWTIEFFAYRTGPFVDYDVIAGKGLGGSFEWFIEGFADGSVDFLYSTNGSGFAGQHELMSNMGLNRWYHFAFVRNGSGANNFKMYVDGKQVFQTTAFDINTGTGVLQIGGYTGAAAQDPPIIISNFRMVKGTSVYTSEFTPPTEPLTNITNTKLLTCQTPTTYQIAAVAPLVSGVNDGTVWSSSITSDSVFRSGFPAKYAFNGNTKSSTNDCTATPQQQGKGFAFTFGEGVPFTTLQMQCDDNNGGKVFVNGVDITSQLPTGSLTNTTITGVTSPLTSISVLSTTGDALYLGSVTIDGTMLVDPLVPEGNAVTTNFNPFNTDINTVRGRDGGYTTWNTLDVQGLDAGDLKDGNLSITHSAGNWLAIRANKFVSSGKWYYEVKVGNNQYTSFGVGSVDYKINPTGGDWMNVANVYGFYPYDGTVYDAGSSRSYTTADTSAAGNVYGIAIDMDNKTLRFYVNGRDLGIAFDSTTTTNFVNKESVAPMAWLYNQSGTDEYNFGQKPFKYAPPDGFQPLTSSTARPDTVVPRPDQYFDTVLYTADQSGGKRMYTSAHMSPDLVWIKNRDNAENHYLADTVRGTSVNETGVSNKYLRSNTTDTEANSSPGTGGPTITFRDDGYELIDSDYTQGEVYFQNRTYVSWCWKAGGSSNTFNIDDEGYANASDVNMSVGGLNSSYYNTSETWSSGLSALSGSITNPANGFDGNEGSYADSTAGFTLDLSGHTFGTGAHTIEIKSGGATSLMVVGPMLEFVFLTDPGGGGAKIWTGTFTGEIDSIISSPSGASVYYVKIDGKILVNSGTDLSGLTQYPSVPNTGCSVGTKQGFSIVAYNATGSNLTVNHGLSERPGFIILKSKNASGDWLVWHQSLSSDTHFLKLNETNSESQASNVFLSVDSNTFGTGNDSGINSGTQQKIAYIWHDVPGLQKFGTFTANNSTDGPYVELGFRPAIVWVKAASNAGDMTYASWLIADGERSPINPVDEALFANKNVAEGKRGNGSDNYTGDWLDILSNGFKIRYTGTEVNGVSGQTYIYCAWAEAPAFNLYGAQSNAR
jgi:hypothetical protein